MRTKEQNEKTKQLIMHLKNTEAKIKKIEKEERNLERLKKGDFSDMRAQPMRKVQGVFLLSQRFQSKLPLPEPMTQKIDATLKAMKI